MSNAFNNAIIAGDLDFVKSQMSHYDRDSQYFAIYYERTEIFEYFMSIKRYNKAAMMAAIATANSNMVDYLILNNYSTDKNAAFRYGSIESIEYLMKKMNIDADFAATYGRIDVLKKFECTHKAMRNAALNKHLDVIKYLVDIGIKPNELALFDAMQGDNYEIFRYLFELIKPVNTHELVDYATAWDAVEILTYLFDVADYPSYIINTAISNGSLKCLKFLKGRVETNDQTITLLYYCRYPKIVAFMN